jgi:hypothetical protein
MAFQFSTGVRNAALDAIETNAGTSCSLEIRSGTIPATCATAPSGSTVLVTMNLPSNWLADASGGAKSKAGTWEDTSADATGTASYFRIYNSQATKDETTCIIQGTVATSGGDMTVANTSIAATQPVTVTAFTINAGGA